MAEVAEYVDGNGNTWQLTQAQANRLGYKKVRAEVETKVVEAEPAVKPPARRTASTK